MLSEVKRKSYNIITLCIFIILFIGGIWSVNNILTNFVEKTNIVCAGQKFASVDEAIFAMESYEREINDTDLDYCPPYKVIYSFNYEKNIIVLYSYCYSFDGKESSSYAIRILKLNEDGTLSFDSGFAEFYMTEPNGNENYYYFTNIKTTQSSKSISFLYLPKDSDKNVFVDGIKAEKILVLSEEEQFYICYAISKRDTLLSNLFLPISQRHKVEVK